MSGALLRPGGLALLCCLTPAQAQEYSPAYLDQDDPDNIDAEDSLDYRYSEEDYATMDGDIRGGYFNTRVDDRDGSREDSDEFALRLRYGVNLDFFEKGRFDLALGRMQTRSVTLGVGSGGDSDE